VEIDNGKAKVFFYEKNYTYACAVKPYILKVKKKRLGEVCVLAHGVRHLLFCPHFQNFMWFVPHRITAYILNIQHTDPKPWSVNSIKDPLYNVTHLEGHHSVRIPLNMWKALEWHLNVTRSVNP